MKDAFEYFETPGQHVVPAAQLLSRWLDRLCCTQTTPADGLTQLSAFGSRWQDVVQHLFHMQRNQFCHLVGDCPDLREEC